MPGTAPRPAARKSLIKPYSVALITVVIAILLSPTLLDGQHTDSAPAKAASPTGATASPSGAAAPTGATAATAASACHPFIELAKAAIWPLIALIIAVVYRQPLGQFFSAIGARVTKVSVFKVELELGKAAESGVTLGAIKAATNSADLNDSSVALFQQVQGTAPADYAVIDIGEGQEWLTSRLFIGVVMLQRMRGLRCVVFTERFQATDKRLVAVVPAVQLRWALAKQYPYLETAFARAYTEAQPTGDITHIPEPSQVLADIPFVVGENGAIQPYSAQQLTKRFIDLLQIPMPATAGWNQGGRLPKPEEWVPLRPPVVERAEWVTRPLLRTLLPDSAFNACITETREQPKAKRALPVLEFASSEFIAMVDSERSFLRLVDRRALLEELATQHAG